MRPRLLLGERRRAPGQRARGGRGPRRHAARAGRHLPAEERPRGALRRGRGQGRPPAHRLRARDLRAGLAAGAGARARGARLRRRAPHGDGGARDRLRPWHSRDGGDGRAHADRSRRARQADAAARRDAAAQHREPRRPGPRFGAGRARFAARQRRHRPVRRSGRAGLAYDAHTAVSGDTLELWTPARRLKRVTVRGHARMDYSGAPSAAAGESSRLTGNVIDAWFTDDQLDSLLAVGQARDEYAAPQKTGQTAETNSATGDSIAVFLKQRKIDRARVEGGAAGEYHMAVDVGDTTAAKNEVVSYDAKRIHFVVPKSQIVLDHDAHLVYRDLELRSRRVEYDVERHSLVASGDPDLTDRGERVVGHLMSYDMSTRVGTI